MTEQEQKKLNEVIKYIEKLEAECFQDYINATNDNTHYYFRGAYINIGYCLEKIIKELNIKD